MKHRSNLYLLYLPAILLFIACGYKGHLKDNDKKQAPNILLILTDDQAMNTIHALGNDEIYTPNIDQLVESGICFSNAFNMGSWTGAVCVPSRTMLNTGRSLWDAKKLIDQHGGKDSILLKQSWASLLNEAGYQTFMTGKWHVKMHAPDIFDQVEDIRPGMPADAWRFQNMRQKIHDYKTHDSIAWNDIMPVGYNRPLFPGDNSWSPSDPDFGGFWEGGKHWSKVVKENAVEFINEQNGKQPFFMYVAFNAPHDPRQSPKEFLDLYSLDSISIPENYQSEHPLKEEMGCGRGLRDECLAPFPRTELAVKTHILEYYSAISYLDQQVGEILEALRKKDLQKNTYIFFTSDHGLAMGQHGLMGKQNLYEHSIKVPLIISGPSIVGGKSIDKEVYLQDIMPTSLELAQMEVPEQVYFKSMIDLLKEPSKYRPYGQIYGAYKDAQRMIRKYPYKLIMLPKAGEIMLFNIKNDPFELENLARHPDKLKQVETLFNEFTKLQKEVGDELILNDLYLEWAKNIGI